MTNPLMDRTKHVASEHSFHPTSEHDWQEWCDKMNAGHHHAGTDEFFFLRPREGGGVYPKKVKYLAFGGLEKCRDHPDQFYKYFEACGLDDAAIRALKYRIRDDNEMENTQ